MYKHISEQAHKLVGLVKPSITSKTKLMTLTSGKGGVGKSTFTANLGYILATKGYKVCLVDADIGLANLQVLLNLKPNVTLFDYIDGKASILDVILETEYHNLSLVAGKSGYQYSHVSNSYVFTKAINDILSLNTFDLVIVDTGAGLNDYVQEFLEISQNIVAVTTTDPSALTDVYALIKMLSDMNKNDVLLCFNHTKTYQIGSTITNSLTQLARKNKINSDFMIKYQGNVATSANIQNIARMRKLLSKEFPSDPFVLELHLIADSLINNLK